MTIESVSDESVSDLAADIIRGAKAIGNRGHGTLGATRLCGLCVPVA